MLKKELRKKYKELRANLTNEEVLMNSLAIANQLLKLPVWDEVYYHLFLTIQDQKEVDTEQVLHILHAKSKEIVVSKSNFKNNTLDHYLLTENTRLKVSAYGIPEPLNGLKVPIEEIGIIFVPLLAFDKKGNRVGYGKGFYDAFLKQKKEGALTIGLSFFDAEQEIKEIEEHDIPLDFCVTPNKIYDFNERRTD